MVVCVRFNLVPLLKYVNGPSYFLKFVFPVLAFSFIDLLMFSRCFQIYFDLCSVFKVCFQNFYIGLAKIWLKLECLLTQQIYWMTFKTILLDRLFYCNDIEIAYNSIKDCIILEKWLLNTIKWFHRQKELQYFLVSKK